jgi:hypothetical protein
MTSNVDYSSGCTPNSDRATSLISGNAMQVTGGTGSLQFTFATSTNTITLTQICPSSSVSSQTFTTTPTQVTFFDSANKRVTTWALVTDGGATDGGGD